MQDPKREVKIPALKHALSEARWDALNSGAFDDAELLSWHIWAAAAQASIMPAIAVLEITLRNALFAHSSAIIDEKGQRYRSRELQTWIDADPTLLRRSEKDAIDSVKARLKKRRGKVTVGRLVSGLDMGFWTGLFDDYYDHSSTDGARLWPWLAKRAFPAAPKALRERGSLAEHFRLLREWRNQIVHHKFFWKQHGLARVFNTVADTVGWMNRSAEIALVETAKEWVLRLDDSGPAQFRGVSATLLPRSSGSVTSASAIGADDLSLNAEQRVLQDDLPF